MKLIDTQTEGLLVRALSSAHSLLANVTQDRAFADLTREEIALALRLLDEAKGVGVDPAGGERDYSAQTSWLTQAQVPEPAPPAEPMAEAIADEMREHIRRTWEREVREVHG